MWNGKSVLITGGTGSFGKKFTEILLRDYPEVQRIVIFSRDEFKQFEMANMSQFHGNQKLRFFVGDVRDKDRLYRAFEKIDIVIHAAALKQIPVCEYNPFEAIKTNIIGAQNVIEAAIDRNVKKVVALSTDKACAPVNFYGATKLCSDKLFISGNAYVGAQETKFSVVRYGNIAGSRGSVIPFFRELIESGAKELPITDTRMTRFWLTLEEAAEMVLTALDTMFGGELFVSKAPSVRIVDLAKAMAPNLATKVIGVRPGEKIHEMMISSDDARNTVELDKYYIIQPDFTWWKNSRLHKEGKKVADNFKYDSESNAEWLRLDDIRRLIGALHV
ncbi:MAG TPA: UDP-N-acetylglucosamine 4,6-dehydratase (inverting) [Patescibacteria group bacterium]|nr:UDP-N-acetylglucosamine 4,6-dehydratase (inverting) [Patescibacteria group bacterium]